MFTRTKTIARMDIFDNINKILPNEITAISSREIDIDSEQDKDSEEDDDTEDNNSNQQNYIVSIPNENEKLNFPIMKQIMLCIYQVRTDGLYPFIQFLLLKKTEENTLSFITLPSSIKINGLKKLNYAMLSYIEKEVIKGNVSYSGFYEDSNKVFIVLKYSPSCLREYVINEDKMTNNYIWATSSEILNFKNIWNYFVHTTVIDFFLSNPAFLTLKSIDGALYESPMIGYYIVHHYVNNIDEMDIYRETIIPELGKSYYLYVNNPENIDADVAVDIAVDIVVDIGKTKNIMRIAFFQGKMIVYNGKKIYNNYDSVLCEIDGTKRYLITDYNQHVVLSYQLIANKIL